MKLKNYIVLAIVAAIVYYWIDSLTKSKKQIKTLKNENYNLKKAINEDRTRFDKFQKEIIKEINSRDELTFEIKKQLKDLVDSYEFIDNDITIELKNIISLVETKQETKAIFDLTKIIENLLKKIYKEDSNFISKYCRNNRRPVLADYLKHAKDEKLIEHDEFEFASGLRVMRNKEAHEVNFNKSRNWIATGFLTGISLIFKIYNFYINHIQKTDNQMSIV